MRNAFVVLVSLCIGVVFGFIVPSSTPENIDKNNISRPDASRSSKVNDEKSMTNTKSAVLPKNRTNIDEKDLFEHATEKQNNQSERAYVYINQKYNRIKHQRNKLIKMVPVDKPNSANAYAGPPPTLMSAQQIPCVSCQKAFSPLPNYNTKYQGFHLEDAKHGQESILNLAAPDMFRWKFNEKPEKKENVLKMQMSAPASNRMDERRDYLELLKSPLLRPESRKVSYEKVNKIDMPIVLPSSITPNSETFIKEYLKNQYVNKLKEVMTRQNELRNNYGFNGAFIRRPYQLEEIGNRAEELSFINEDENRKNVEINQEEDRLLDKYLKDTLDDNVPLSHDRVRALPADCDQEDCAFPRKKYAKNNNLFMKPICHCDRNLSLKEVEPFISNDRSLREDKRDRNETALTSAEIMNYEEMLSEGSNLISEDNYVIKARNTRKTNNTLLHKFGI